MHMLKILVIAITIHDLQSANSIERVNKADRGELSDKR